MRNNRSLEEKIFYSPLEELADEMKMDDMLKQGSEIESKKNFDEEQNKTIENIPVSMIDAREVNDYSISDIDELKESIRKNGLQQSIVVKRNGDRYVLIAGERRLTAYRSLLNELGERYSTISAVIYGDNLSAKKEDAIYKETNETQRSSTLFERIYRLNPKHNYFRDGKTLNRELAMEYLVLKMESDKRFKFDRSANEIIDIELDKAERIYEMKDRYISRLENINNDIVSIKWDDNQTMNDYIMMKLASRYKDVNLSIDGVKKYTQSIINCAYKPIITELIFKGKLAPSELREISGKSEEKQIEIYNKITNGEPWKDETPAKIEVKELSPEEKMNDLSRELMLFVKHFDNSGIDQMKWTGNNKKTLTKMRNIKAIIESLNSH